MCDGVPVYLSGMRERFKEKIRTDNAEPRPEPGFFGIHGFFYLLGGGD